MIFRGLGTFSWVRSYFHCSKTIKTPHRASCGVFMVLNERGEGGLQIYILNPGFFRLFFLPRKAVLQDFAVALRKLLLPVSSVPDED